MNKRKIFISYSRENGKYVDRVINDLRSADFEVWRDSDNLQSNTPSWDRAIREAIKECEAVVLCASPDALASDHVNGELDLARRHNRQIYSAWIIGDTWVDCVPLNMSKHHCSDCRDGNYTYGITELITTLEKALNPQNSIRLGLPTHEIIDLGVDQFDSGFQLANHVYLNFLQEWYNLFTYGREWVLVNVKTKQIAMPHQWLSQSHDEEAIRKLNRDQLDNTSPQIKMSDVGIVPGSYWAVWDARRLKATGVFLREETLFDRILSENGISEIDILIQEERFTETSFDDAVLSQYPYQLVIAAYNSDYDGRAIIEV